VGGGLGLFLEPGGRHLGLLCAGESGEPAPVVSGVSAISAIGVLGSPGRLGLLAGGNSACPEEPDASEDTSEVTEAATRGLFFDPGGLPRGRLPGSGGGGVRNESKGIPGRYLEVARDTL
jgi:hypothetical protein